MRIRSAALALLLLATIAPAVRADGDGTPTTPAATAPAPTTPATDDPHLTLGKLAQGLAQTPGATDALLAKLAGAAGNPGTVPLGPDQRAALADYLKRGDYSALDSQPALTLGQLDALVQAANAKAQATAKPATPPAGVTTPVTEPLGIPVADRTLPQDQAGAQLAPGVTANGTFYDDDLRQRFPDSKRLAQVLERLATNVPGQDPVYTVLVGDAKVTTAEGLVDALRATGHTVQVIDERRVANFADVREGPNSVAAPLWVKTGRKLADGSEVQVPAPHTELILEVSGPDVNADVSFFNGVDTSGQGNGGVRYRPYGSRGKAWWTGGRVAHVYTGDDAKTAVRLMGEMREEASAVLASHPLALQGYYSLGVCATAAAVVEQAITGKTTAWPLVQDPALFSGDSEVDRIVQKLPRDGTGPLDEARLVASLPWADPTQAPFEQVRRAATELSGAPDAATMGKIRARGAGPDSKEHPSRGIDRVIEENTKGDGKAEGVR